MNGKLVDDNTIRVEDRVDTTMVRVRKIWSDHNYSKRPTSVKFHLLRNSKQLQDAKYTVTLTTRTPATGRTRGPICPDMMRTATGTTTRLTRN